MSPQFHNKVYNHLLVFFICVCLIYSTVHAASSAVNSSGIQCVESERAALLRFKHDIRVDNCGLLDSWGDSLNCCQWDGIHCSNRLGHIIGLHLPGIGDPYNYTYKACLEGTLSESLLELKHLKYLDLSLNHFRGQIPKFIGSFANLEHLNLSHAGFEGVIPQEIGNLSRLSSLDLHHKYRDSNMRVKNLRWLSHLRFLKQFDLSNIDLSAATNTWLQIVNSLPILQDLRLNGCRLSLELSSSLSYINSSSSLKVISLSNNKINNTSIFKWMFNLKGLEYLDLSRNQMFGNDIKVSGHAVQILGSLCNLQTLFLFDTTLYYDFSGIVQSFSACPHKALASLGLSSNQVWGSIPDNIDTLSSLRFLELSENQLNGTISQSLGGLSTLEILDLESNSLKAVVTEKHLSNLSKLRMLLLRENTELVVNISANWIPPFQLDYLDLDSCKVGPDFPMWLTTQKQLTYIHLYNTSISDTVPVSFFNSLSSKLQYLEMSQNMMHGVIPNVSITFDIPPIIDLSSNKFHGTIPPFLTNVSQLFLENNLFSHGMVPLLCPQNKMPLTTLDLSNNLLSDKLPDCWEYFDKLQLLNLQNNNLWGSLPTTIGKLTKLNILYVSNNSISGKLPLSLVNCKSLVILDISHNSLTGYIPTSFWYSFKYLSVLILQSNNITGTLPTSFCQLSEIQILDLSSNHIFGTIPKCICDFHGMTNTSNLLQTILEDLLGNISIDPSGGPLIMWKRKESFFQIRGTLGLAKTIDFSNNKLEGHIPKEISSLIALKSINLSRNYLSGAIPSKIGQLTSLEVLDLSHNHLSDKIPTSLAKVTTLDVLDLSYNSLSGEIPTGPQLQTFNSSAYMGNPQLCGEPLPKCKGDAATITKNEDNASPHNEHHVDDFMLGLYISVVLGVITGFWGVFGALLLKRTWRHAFFQFYDDMKDKIYVVVTVHIARVWKRT